MKIGDHTFEPVPVAITLSENLVSVLQGKKETNPKAALVRDSVKIYDEISAAEGVLGRFPGG